MNIATRNAASVVTTVDAVLWDALAADILAAEAEVRLPSPPPMPSFERKTVRPGKMVH